MLSLGFRVKSGCLLTLCESDLLDSFSCEQFIAHKASHYISCQRRCAAITVGRILKTSVIFTFFPTAIMQLQYQDC